MHIHYCCYFLRELKIIMYMSYTKSKIGTKEFRKSCEELEEEKRRKKSS